MAFVTIDDSTGRVEVNLRGELLETHGHMIVKDELLVVDGDVSPDDFNGGYKIRAREVYDLTQARARFARRLVINLTSDQLPADGLTELLQMLSNYKSGSTPVCFEYENEQARATIKAGRHWWVNPQNELLDNLSQVTGKDNVQLVY